MTALLSLIVGLFVTMVLLPPLVRVAGRLQLVDKPSHRKMHAVPIPRVGGIAIYAGFLVPLLLWAPLEQIDNIFLLGGGLIVLFGAIDDRLALVVKWKFAGQAVAVMVVMAAGVRFDVLPFFGLDPVTPWITYPISFLFILGVTNALNLSDGLDGLAGGASLLSLAGIGALAYMSGGPTIYLGAVALAGAMLGFLRFNTHPAVVFLGDAGSQFLGFSLACMAIILTQDVNPALNPMLPLFIVGLPLLDTLSVILMRLWHKQSPFSADNRHFHHRLLRIGLRHYEAVAVIYTLQATAVSLAFLLRYQSDALALVAFLAFAGLIYGVLCVAESLPRYAYARVDPDLNDEAAQEDVNPKIGLLDRFAWLPMASARYVLFAVSAFLVGAPFLVDHPPRDIAFVAVGAAAMMVFAHFFLNPWTRLFVRVGTYALGIFTVFLVAPVTTANAGLDMALNIYLVALSAVLALAIRLTRRDTFQMTPQDLLVLFLVVAIPNLPLHGVTEYPIGSMAFRAAVVFYACEYVLSRDNLSYRLLRVASFAGLAILGLRGFL